MRDVVFVERTREGGASVAAGSEDDLLFGVRNIWVNSEISRHQFFDVN